MLKVDLLDEEAISSLDLTQFDYIFHLAGLAAVGPSFEAPKRYITSNTEMQINLFEACVKQGVKPGVLIISSGSLYDPAKLPITELSPLKLGSPYAVSKLNQESIGLYYRERGFAVTIARPFNHIGPGQAKGFLVPDLADQLKGPGKQATVKAGNLTNQRDYTDVRDIVRAYALLMTKGKSGEIYNVCSGVSVSGEEILAELSKVYGVTASVQTDASKIRPTDIQKIYGSFDKLKRDTGWSPSISLQQTLADIREASL
jgi:GDP-4-dehydro-6-deoxy-D-mannose reductase